MRGTRLTCEQLHEELCAMLAEASAIPKAGFSDPGRCANYCAVSPPETKVKLLGRCDVTMTKDELRMTSHGLTGVRT